MSLSDRHKAFADKYIELHMNAVQAYMEVYGTSNYNAAGVSSHDLLKNPKVRQYINDRLSAMAMSADEVMYLVREQATGTINDFLNEQGDIDLDKARKRGKLHLVKKYKQTIDKDGNVHREVELYPADSAQDKIMRYHGLYNDKVTVTWRDKIPADKQELVDQFFKTAVRVAKQQVDE